MSIAFLIFFFLYLLRRKDHQTQVIKMEPKKKAALPMHGFADFAASCKTPHKYFQA